MLYAAGVPVAIGMAYLQNKLDVIMMVMSGLRSKKAFT